MAATIYNEITNYQFPVVSVADAQNEEYMEYRRRSESQLATLKQHIQQNEYTSMLNVLNSFIEHLTIDLRLIGRDMDMSSNSLLQNWRQQLRNWKEALYDRGTPQGNHAQLWQALHTLTRIMGQIRPGVLVGPLAPGEEGIDEDGVGAPGEEASDEDGSVDTNESETGDDAAREVDDDQADSDCSNDE